MSLQTFMEACLIKKKCNWLYVSFHFILGQVPNCERCHECYFQWYDITSELASRVSALFTNTQSLLTTYYNGHTMESIQREIDLLLGQLENATLTLGRITLSEGDITDLEQVIMQVCVLQFVRLFISH